MDVDEIIDGLYGLPLGEFTRERDRAARELRSEGRRAEADELKALRRPTAAAGAVNRLVREHAADVKAFLTAAAVLRDAQLEHKSDLRAATERERELLGQLVSIAGQQVRRSLQAAAVDEEAARELLLGRLEKELEPRGFGTLLEQVKRTSARPGKPTRSATKPKKPDDSAARRKLREAQQALATAEAEERRAHQVWTQTETELESAKAAVEIGPGQARPAPGLRPWNVRPFSLPRSSVPRLPPIEIRRVTWAPFAALRRYDRVPGCDGPRRRRATKGRVIVRIIASTIAYSTYFIAWSTLV